MTTLDLDGDEASDGLMTLVVTVVELLLDALEREAVRRMESGSLTDDEIERLGSQLAAMEDELDRLKEEQDIGEGVDQLRGDLSSLVEDAVRRIDGRESLGYAVIDEPSDAERRRGRSESTGAEAHGAER
ncbi:gas vesicle protein GvpK [Halegenticoccus tardaugens]|uniref:gas vesicle protein GvpK n=1 Tax=Halegenticoccus tardaugens TaxID=2071624 RepID=UPI00100B3A24|nr:gas vesicle protein GvpK [Halegenticoccus tardaugens]